MNQVLISCFFFVNFVTLSKAGVCTFGNSPANPKLSEATTDNTKTVIFSYERDTTNTITFQMAVNQKTIVGKAVEGFSEFLTLDGNKYKLDQMRLRWGETAISGSEHVIKGDKFEGEIQLEHSKADSTSVGPAMVIVSVLIETSIDRMDDDEETKQLWKFISNDKLSAVNPIQRVLNENKASMKKYLTGSFLRYTGTPTVEPCNIGVVEWLVFQNPLMVNYEYFDTLRAVKGADGNPMLKSNLKDLVTNNVYKYKTFVSA